MTTKELELRDQKFALLDKVEAIQGKAEKRSLTASESAMAEKLLAEAEGFNAKIQEERIRADKANLELDRQYGTVRDADGNIISSNRSRNDEETRATAPLKEVSYRSLCERTDVDHSDLNGWETSTQFWTALLNRSFDERLYRSHNTKVFGEGAAIVPELVSNRLMSLSLEKEIVRPRCTNYPVPDGQGRTYSVPRWDDFDRSSGTITGTLKLQWVGEEQEITETQGKVIRVDFDLKKAAALIPLSNELLSDAPQFIPDLEEAVGQALAFGIDDALLNGLGGGQPLGVLNGANKIAITAETGQAAATILPENLAKMQARMLPASLTNGSAVWLAHPSTYPQLRLLVLPIGTGGNTIPMLQGDARTGWTLNGIELLFSEKMAALGTVGDVALADLSRYATAARPGLNVAMSAHLGFNYDKSHLRVITRLDGKPLDSTATTPKNGSTFSSTVTLATRS